MNAHDRRYPDMPTDIDAEAGLIGGLFLRNERFADAAAAGLTHADFSEPVHALIFDGMAQMAARGEAFSPATIRTVIGEHTLAGGVTLNEYLARLVAHGASARELPGLAAAIKQASFARAFIKSALFLEQNWKTGNREKLVSDALAGLAGATQAGAGRAKDFGRIRLGDVARRERRPLDYIVDDWLVASEQSFIAGESQSGKSFLAMHAAMCIATGRPFFGRDVQPGLVIYQAGESGTGVLDLRIPAWLDHHGVTDASNIPLEILPARVDLFSPEGDAAAFLATVKRIAADWHPIPLRAVFIDTLSKVMPGANENDGRDISRVLSRFEAISRETGAHVCVIHHLPKAGGSMRGHGSLKGDVDSVAMIEHNQATGVRTMRFAKRKDGPAGGSLAFELMAVDIGTDEKGRRINSCVCLPVGEKEAIRKDEAAKGYRLTDAEIVFMRALFDAEKKHGQAVPPDLDIPPGVRWVVAYSDVKRAYGGLNPSDADMTGADETEQAKARQTHAEKLKQRLRRIREQLTGAGVVSFAGDFIYWTGKPLRAFPHTQPARDPDPPPVAAMPDDDGLPF